jgi:histone-lysine N-methyltransferase SETD3
MGKETWVGKQVLNSNIELDAPKHIFIMLFILIDRIKPDSFFRPYYDILPPTLRNMPVFWDEREMSYLKGSFLVQQILERKEAIEGDYRSICAIVPTFTDICDLEMFKWARMCVCSRNFGIVVNGLRTAALVPYADMLNHLRPRQTKWQFENSSQSFTISSLTGIGCGIQVYDSYGQKCNHRFLLNYGFSVENNVEADGYCPNEVPFVVGLSSDDACFEEKAAILRRDGGSGTTRRVRVSVGDSDGTKVLLALLRLTSLDKEEFDEVSVQSGGFRTLREAMIPFSIENERLTMKALKAHCMKQLDAYPTTYDEDIQRLTTTITDDMLADSSVDPVITPFSNERHAVIQVKGEKEVLGHFLAMSELALDLLTSECSEIELEAIVRGSLKGKVHESIYQYCRSSIVRLVRDQARARTLNEVNQSVKDGIDVSGSGSGSDSGVNNTDTNNNTN